MEIKKTCSGCTHRGICKLLKGEQDLRFGTKSGSISQIEALWVELALKCGFFKEER